MLIYRSGALKFLLGLLGMGGFGLLMSCTKYGAPIAEYGAPYNENMINFHGIVKSSDSLKPISNIKIKVYSGYPDTVSTTTNTAGNYSIDKFSYLNQNLKIAFEDKDGLTNGRFLDTTIDVNVDIMDLNNLEHETDVTLQRKP